MLNEHQKAAKAFVVKKSDDEEEESPSKASPSKTSAAVSEDEPVTGAGPETELEKHLKSLTRVEGSVAAPSPGGPPAKRPKLEPVFTEGEVPGETIEVVGADDDLWNNAGGEGAGEVVINVERKKSVHFNSVDPELLEKARQEEIARGGKKIKTQGG